MGILSLLNSTPMYAICGGIIAFVAAVCIVFMVRAYRAGGGLGDLLQVHVFRQLDLPGMDLQSVQPSLIVGPVNNEPPVKTARTQQGLVQDLRPIGGRQAHNALGGLKAVDLA